MSANWGAIISGAMEGGGKAWGKWLDEEQQQAMKLQLQAEQAAIQAARDEKLSKQRIKEHEETTAADIRLKDEQRKKTEGESAQFFKDNKLPNPDIAGVEIDTETRKPIGTIIGEGKVDEKEQAAHYAQKALVTGNQDIIKEARGEDERVRKWEEQNRKAENTDIAAERNAIALELGLARVAAIEARAKAGGNSEATAKQKELITLATTAFGYDPKKGDEDPANKKALALAANRIWKENSSGEYTTSTETGFDDKGNKVTTTQRRRSGGHPSQYFRGGR